MVSFPSGQTPLAAELIIHNRCSEMFGWIYDRALRNSQVSLWCYFSLLSYKYEGLHDERMSAQLFFPSPRFPCFLRFHTAEDRALTHEGGWGTWEEICSFLPLILLCCLTFLAMTQAWFSFILKAVALNVTVGLPNYEIRNKCWLRYWPTNQTSL